MDTRIIWMMMFITCNIGTIWCVAEDRNMTECHNGGVICSRWSKCKFDSAKSNFTCTCVAGYMGELCNEDRNECERGIAPCKRRGVCHNSVGSFRCDCVPGWEGSHCQTSDGSGLSTCPTGYTGVKCTDDFDECTQWSEKPCEHGSTCVNTPGNFTCNCTTGWEGRICNKDINECNFSSGSCHNGGNCTNIPGAYRCDCPYPYTGHTCDDVPTTINTPTYSAKSTRVSAARIAPKVDKSGMCTLAFTCLLYSGLSLNGGNCTYTPPSSYLWHCSYTYTGMDCYPAVCSPKDDNSNDSDGGTNLWVIIGPVIGILVIAGTFGVGLFVYYYYYRKAHKVDAGNETEVERIKQDSTMGDSNKNSKWKLRRHNDF